MKRAKITKHRRTVSIPVSKPAKPGASGTTATVSVPVLPPRNPYQVLARRRKAGAHDVDARKQRRLEKHELRRKIVDL